jgi:hypothetical protein
MACGVGGGAVDLGIGAWEEDDKQAQAEDGTHLGSAGLIPFVRTGLVNFISGTTGIFTVGWEAGLMENPIPLAILVRLLAS